MRSLNYRPWLYVALLVLAAGLRIAYGAALPRHMAAQQAEWEYFTIVFPPSRDTFVIALSDPQRIAEARRIEQGLETRRIHVLGVITTTAADYNPGWSYHYEPDTIEFFETAIEVCDASPRYVEAHLAEVGGSFLPGRRWCPWSSRVASKVFLPLILR